MRRARGPTIDAFRIGTGGSGARGEGYGETGTAPPSPREFRIGKSEYGALRFVIFPPRRFPS